MSTSTAFLSQPSATSAATRAALELVVSSGVGIASIHNGLLNAATIKALSQATFTILLPLFLGTSIIKTISSYGLSKSSLVVPALAALQSFLLYVFTTKIIYPLCLSSDERITDEARGTAVCASFGNGGVLPLIFCDSLFRQQQNDDLALSTGYVSMFLVGWSPFFWAFGRTVLMGNDHGEGTKSNGNRKNRVGTTTSEQTNRMFALIKKMVPPPVMGVLIGMVVATVPILRNFLVGNSDGKIQSTAPLRVIFDTAQNFGKAASPLSLLVLVSSLALGAGFGKQKSSLGKKNEISQTTSPPISIFKRWAIVSFSRFIVSPALMLGLLKAASSDLLGNAIGTSLEQPMLWFVCLLESCMPPAQNQVVMLQVANKMQQANEMATFLFGVYATSMLPLTTIVSLALDRLGLM
mmetsp:Transcript_4356/g.10506  ORF Transcript_4356/g.10506 Transcript_4356/m.10506 type:complete len:409 (+) Transcript_4356:84-1310(+)|eukprot:CAMPEP_0172404998 /NCGR_PEP_ID=MMETSP1061-20121228/65307_1 /TAXON_ID=37318 /ORGANISM="Pseudo-nitzschia pungens, Strain cf. pungens" /LENGTH=408 /DNA_ID=CAMNT_0013140025 /DNA_START=33 /DNA_END=1259 /DNA_ORIENTATION=+